MQNKGVEAVIIDDVIDIDKLIIKADQVLVRVDVENPTGLLLPDGIKESSITKHKWVIVKCGSAVKDYKEGMLLVDFNDKAADFLNHKGKGYFILGSYSIKVATTADNIKSE